MKAAAKKIEVKDEPAQYERKKSTAGTPNAMRLYICKRCTVKQVFKTRIGFDVHRCLLHPTCHICSKKCSRLNKLQKHMQKEHPEDPTLTQPNVTDYPNFYICKIIHEMCSFDSWRNLLKKCTGQRLWATVSQNHQQWYIHVESLTRAHNRRKTNLTTTAPIQNSDNSGKWVKFATFVQIEMFWAIFAIFSFIVFILS